MRSREAEQLDRRDKTIELFRTDMARLLAAVEGVPVALRNEHLVGTWSVQGVLVHIAAWDLALLQAVDAVLAGVRSPWADKRVERFNAEAVDAGRGRTFEEVCAEAKAANEQLLARLRALTGEDWRRVASLFAYRYKRATHYGGHAAEIGPADL